MSPRPLREDAQLLDTYLSVRDSEFNGFSVPGHKRRAHLIDEGLGQLVDSDVQLYGGLDTIKLTDGVLRHAEQRAADYYGVDWLRFSTGGSTHANQTLALSLGRENDIIIVTRSLHRSTLIGIVLAGLLPVWLPTNVDVATGMPLGVSLDDVATALVEHPNAVGLLLTEPGYLGTMSDLEAIVTLSHSRNVPVIMDQAWGAHFGSHPELPAHAINFGADAMVTSTHKLLVGYTQASIAAAQTTRLDRERLNRGFEATHTTSPSGAILASSDACRALLETRGEELIGRVISLVRMARERLREAVPGITIPDESDFPVGRFDPTRLVVQTSQLGVDGVKVERHLLEHNISLELADRDTLLPIITVADTEQSVSTLVETMIPALLTGRGEPRPLLPSISWRVVPQQAMSPREAFFAPHERVAARNAIGRVSAELIAPYPPGVPVLAPGEVVTGELLAELVEVAKNGVRVAYAADSTLATIEVVA